MKRLRRKRPPKAAPSVVHFKSAINEQGHKQICIYAECALSGNLAGPVWGHSDNAIKKSMADLTRLCDCPAKFHRAQDYQGKRVAKSTRLV